MFIPTTFKINISKPANLIFNAALFLSVNVLSFNVHAITDIEVAEHWSPVIYHDTNATYGYEAEYLTNFDYDGDWDGTNNWENLFSFDTASYIYYQVSETSTHWYVGYYAFHPRDDGPPLDQHENDFEGAIIVVKKDATYFGQIQLIITQAHDQFYQYTNDPSLMNAHDSIDGGFLQDQYDRPLLYIQANGSSLLDNGHGWHVYQTQDAPGGDGIVYYRGSTADVPDKGHGNWWYWYSYQLLSMDELWDQRYDYPEPYASFGVFRGDTYGVDAAKTPWKWDDADDGPAYAGAMWSDPAHLIDTHLEGFVNLDRDYISNPNYNYKVTINNAISKKNRDFWGGRSDIYVNVNVNGTKYWGEQHWKKNEANKGTTYNVVMGANNALTQSYDGTTSTVYVSQPEGSEVIIEVYDSDSDADDFMGDIRFTLYAGQSASGVAEYTSNNQAKVTYTVEALQ